MAFNSMRVRVLGRWCVTILLILSLISIATVVSEESEEEEPELYLYEEDAGKVIEYILPEKTATVDPEKPDFLYAPNQGYRIVEFYAVRLISPRVQSLVLLLYKLEYSIEVILLVTSVDACCLLLGLVVGVPRMFLGDLSLTLCFALRNVKALVPTLPGFL